MSGNHVGLKLLTQSLGQNNRMQENGRLCHLGLLKVFRSTLKHQVSDTETENFICFFKERTGLFVVVIQILTHAHKLSTLARKYECFHNQLIA